MSEFKYYEFPNSGGVFFDEENASKLFEHIDELEAENASLRGAVEGFCEESTKLRELVKDMWQFTGAACKKYPRLFDQSAQGGQMVMPNMLDSFEQRMRELGVEVDE